MNSLQNVSDFVKQHDLGEMKFEKYYVMTVDSTPDSSHVEQTTFLLRFRVRHQSRLEIVERFVKFVDCTTKHNLIFYK